LKQNKTRGLKNMADKYEFTGETKTIENTTLRRISALRDIPQFDVKTGDLGGWIENESNLSQFSKARVCDNAVVGGDAVVDGDTVVDGNMKPDGKVPKQTEKSGILGFGGTLAAAKAEVERRSGERGKGKNDLER
jgi:hypothetical protein